MLTLIEHGEVLAPGPGGPQSVLLLGDRIGRIASQMLYTNLVEGQMDATLSAFNLKFHLLGRGYRFDLRERRPVLPVETGEKEKKSA